MQPIRINVPPPVETGLQLRLSFAPFIRYLQQQKETAAQGDKLTFIYDTLLAKFLPYQDYLVPTGQVVVTEALEELFTLVKYSILPFIHQGEEIPYAIGLPCQPLTLFHYADTFKHLTHQQGEIFTRSSLTVIRQDSLRAFYRLILNKCYHYPISKPTFPLVTFTKTQDGLTKYYRMRLDFRFIDPSLVGELPPLQPEWVAFAQNELPTAEEIPVTLPLTQFTFDGFAFFQIEDITEEVTIQELKEVFVHLSSEVESEIYLRFEKALRNLCGQPDLEIGIMPFLQVNGRHVQHKVYTSRSIFFKNNNCFVEEITDAALQTLLREIIADPRLRIIKDLSLTTDFKHQFLYQKGFRSFIMYPLVVSNQALGMLEIGSKHPNALNGEVLRRVEQAIPLVVELLLYQINEFRTRMEEIIRKKFTLLQPALEWKFTDAAWAYLQKGEDASPDDEATQVYFKQVYPFYGAIDVRNSSVERNAVLQQDLSRQFRALEKILKNAANLSGSHQSDSMLARVYHWQRRLTQVISPEEENQISVFLRQQIHPQLQKLATHPGEATSVADYFSNIDPETGLFNQAFQAYELSLAQINKTVNTFMEQEARELQNLFPNYFEKFRTDGLEYNLYVGSAIAPWLTFKPQHLQQFRAWQLNAMVQMATLTHDLLPALPLPLKTTQLILAHSHPVDIKFRLDEHRFDVEGSYSIRYEVIKKRLDKAYVKDTNQRLTQPDTIALVYTTRTELDDFLPLVYRLQQEQKLTSTLEYLELESLQGVTGLKALRLRINYSGAQN